MPTVLSRTSEARAKLHMQSQQIVTAILLGHDLDGDQRSYAEMHAVAVGIHSSDSGILSRSAGRVEKWGGAMTYRDDLQGCRCCLLEFLFQSEDGRNYVR